MVLIFFGIEVDKNVVVKNFKDGLRNGKFIGWYENGNISSEKYFKNNVKEGKWTTYYQNGQKARNDFIKMGE